MTQSNDHKGGLVRTAKRRAATIVRLKDYLARTGITREDFGRRASYSLTAIKYFLTDSYHHISSSDDAIDAAVNSYMDAHPIVALSAPQGALFQTANVALIHKAFNELLPKPRAFMIYAPPGSQKSFVLQHAIADLNQRELPKNGHGRRAYYVYARQGIRPLDFMRRIAVACGVSSTGNVDRILNNVRHEFATRRVLLVIDEAQHLEIECFEVIRELLDLPPHFSLLFAGSHDLFSKFDRFSATLEQWNSRITQKVRLPGASREEARGIVQREIGHILKLNPKAVKAAESLIDQATVKNAYEKGATYINIRTLCNSLDDIKAKSEEVAQ